MHNLHPYANAGIGADTDEWNGKLAAAKQQAATIQAPNMQQPREFIPLGGIAIELRGRVQTAHQIVTTIESRLFHGQVENGNSSQAPDPPRGATQVLQDVLDSLGGLLLRLDQIEKQL